MLQLVVYAILAFIVGSLLYNVLGKPVGHMPKEKKKRALPNPAQKKPLDPVKNFTGPAGLGLTAIAQADTHFDLQNFMKGARLAYEKIVRAYLEGNKTDLEPLLTPELYTLYSRSIEERGEEKNLVQNVRVLRSELLSARLEEDLAHIEVHFIAEIITDTSGEKGQESSADSHAERVEEIWVFERPVTSANPNWSLSRVSDIDEE